MDQITFEEVEVESKELLAYKSIEPTLEDALQINYVDPKHLIFKHNQAEGSAYSSIYLINEGNLVCRMCFRGKTNYIAVPAKYEEMIPPVGEVKKSKSDPNYVRIFLSSSDDIRYFAAMLWHILDDMIAALPTEFGCCSRYIECSDAKRCVNPDMDLSMRCYYKKNLRKGIIFYGKNKNS